ncbi:hypothetical protein NP233_g1317 [Leucocoprinus birnbaumii]|uniref:Fruit-body specific protein a n=1 Tax=Leucocoprinus birnbaumii TaxID=56174 RepID=A0AAD5YVY5_9AGAR|nr:hypothetical protein NP233_g1317 [Leucocoprinus birnbaumii]
MLTSAFISIILANITPSVFAGPLEASAAVILTGKDLSAQNHYGAPSPPWHSGSKPGWYYGPHPSKSPTTLALTPQNCKWLAQYPQGIHCPHSYTKPSMSSHHPGHPSPSHSDVLQHSTYDPPLTLSSSAEPPSTTQESSDIDTSASSQTFEIITVPTAVYTGPVHSPTITTHELASASSYPLAVVPLSSNEYYRPTFSNITAAVQADDYLTFGLVETADDCKAMCDFVQGCTFVNTYHDVHGKDGSPLLTCSLFTLCHSPEDADNSGGQSQEYGSTNFIVDSDGWCKNVY